MARIINGTLYVDSFNSTGNSGEYDFTNARYESQTDTLGLGATAVQPGFIIYTSAMDATGFFPLPGVAHRYKITNIFYSDMTSLTARMVWDEDDSEYDLPISGSFSLITEDTPNHKYGLPPSTEVYTNLSYGMVEAAYNADIRRITDKLGFTGMPGLPGTTGIQGLTGSKGSQGVTGLANFWDLPNYPPVGVPPVLLWNQYNEALYVGITGVGHWVQVSAGSMQGVTGAAGISGSTGTSGTTGIQGIQGIKGITGSSGTTGIQGIQGTAGDTGVIGPTGMQGIIGLTGIRGITGNQGIKGDTGIIGPTGFQGVIGQTGLKGIQGPFGQTGIQGLLGPTGIQGILGNTGVLGPVGSQGSTGIRGIAGSIGTTGLQGHTGLGIQGQTGLIGFTGVQGPTGISLAIFSTRSGQNVSVDSALTTFQYGKNNSTKIYGYVINNTGIPNNDSTKNNDFFKWDLSPMVVGSGISDASMVFFCDLTSSDSSIINVYRMLSQPNYIDTNWLTKDGTNAWLTPGGDYDTTVLASWVYNQSGPGDNIVNFNIDGVNVLQSMINGLIPNYGFINVGHGNNFTGRYKGFLNTDVTNRPRLFIRYNTIGGVGSQGATGIRGTTGPFGCTGFQGSTGVRGITGLSGFGGATGFQGVTGLQGIQGNTGIRGLGMTGFQGIQGDTGIQGNGGQTGLQGLTGLMTTNGLMVLSASGDTPLSVGTLAQSMFFANTRFISWTLLTDVTSLINVNIQKSDYLSYPNMTSMHGSTGIFIDSGLKNTGTTEWWPGSTGAQGDIIRATLVSTDSSAAKIDLLLSYTIS